MKLLFKKSATHRGVSCLIFLYLLAMGLLLYSCTMPSNTVEAPSPPAIIPTISHNASTPLAVSKGSIEFTWTTKSLPESTTDNPVNFNIYFGTTNPPTTIIAKGLSNTSYIYSYGTGSSNTVTYDTVYYWTITTTYKEGDSTKTVSSAIQSLVTESGSVIVYLTQSRGGAPVSDATVVLKNEEGAVINPVEGTNTSIGKFIYLTNSEYTGTYTARATKTDLASSTATFSTSATNDTITVSMLLLPQVSTERDNASTPTISVTGISPNVNITSTDNIELSISVNTDSTINLFTEESNRKILSLSIGNTGNSNYLSDDPLDSDRIKTDPAKLVQETDRKKYYIYTLDPKNIASGVQLLEFVAYDNNNNQGVLIIPLTIAYNAASATNQYPPASSSASLVKIYATTIGENANVYGVSEDARITVEILVKGVHSGVLVYRGLGNIAPSYVGSSTIKKTVSGIEYLYYKDQMPSLSDDAIYTYQLKLYNYHDTEGTLISTLSKKFRVPILPKYELTLVTPSNNTTYRSVPSTIDFSWKAHYSQTILSTLNESYLTRSDDLFLVDTLTGDYFIDTVNQTNSFTPKIDYGDSNNELYSYSFKALNHSFRIAGRHLFWTVASTISYHLNKETTEFYSIESVSSPTKSSLTLPNNAHNGAFFITIK